MDPFLVLLITYSVCLLSALIGFLFYFLFQINKQQEKVLKKLADIVEDFVGIADEELG